MELLTETGQPQLRWTEGHQDMCSNGLRTKAVAIMKIFVQRTKEAIRIHCLGKSPTIAAIRKIVPIPIW